MRLIPGKARGHITPAGIQFLARVNANIRQALSDRKQRIAAASPRAISSAYRVKRLLGLQDISQDVSEAGDIELKLKTTADVRTFIWCDNSGRVAICRVDKSGRLDKQEVDLNSEHDRENLENVVSIVMRGVPDNVDVTLEALAGITGSN